MAQIKPIQFPLQEGIATTLVVQVNSFPTDAVTATTYNRLTDDNGLDMIPAWNYTMTEEQFQSWGVDNSVVDQYVAEAKGLEII